MYFWHGSRLQVMLPQLSRMPMFVLDLLHVLVEFVACRSSSTCALPFLCEKVAQHRAPMQKGVTAETSDLDYFLSNSGGLGCWIGY